MFDFRDDHGFSPLHWAAMKGHLKIVDMLVIRGARINATNRGDDTPLHLAAAHGHSDIVTLVNKQQFRYRKLLVMSYFDKFPFIMARSLSEPNNLSRN